VTGQAFSACWGDTRSNPVPSVVALGTTTEGFISSWGRGVTFLHIRHYCVFLGFAYLSIIRRGSRCRSGVLALHLVTREGIGAAGFACVLAYEDLVLFKGVLMFLEFRHHVRLAFDELFFIVLSGFLELS